MEGNHFSGVEGVTKAKNVYFHKKLVFSIFGQKQVLLVKPTYVLLPITKARTLLIKVNKVKRLMSLGKTYGIARLLHECTRIYTR